MKNSNFELFIKRIGVINPNHSKFLSESIEIMTKEEKEEFNSYLNTLLNQKYTLEYITDCYNFIVKDMFKQQLYFKKYQRYQFDNFEEILKSVYLNNEKMKKHTFGLAISLFLWKHHIKLRRWFLERLPRNQLGRYLELGIGHGYHFMKAIQLTNYEFFEALDISPISVVIAKALLENNNIKNFNIEETDVFKKDERKKYNAIVAGELLEHVEQPDLLLKKIYNLALPTAFIYLSTVINSPAIDHIYLFKDVDSVISLIKKQNFNIVKHIVIPVYNQYTIEENEKKKLPMIIGLVLEVKNE